MLNLGQLDSHSVLQTRGPESDTRVSCIDQTFYESKYVCIPCHLVEDQGVMVELGYSGSFAVVNRS
ncbi:MAG: hypothetical protein ACI81L_000548 [Verrucomicrobiales bacterium]|jgi:hypothetical protein